MIKLRFGTSRIALGDLVGILGALIIVVSLITVFRSQLTGSDTGQPTTQGQPPTSTPEKTNKPEGENKPPQPTPLPSSLELSKPAGESVPTPSAILNLSNWKLTLPIETSHPGNPDEIRQPELGTYTLSPYFEVNGPKDGVTFRAYAGGVTTSGSSYPRSELREMTNSGKQSASWSNSSGTHTLVIKQAITHLPALKPDVVAGQIHDAADYVILVRLDGKRLFIQSQGQFDKDLDTNYNLGTIFTVKIVAAEGRINVYYNDVQKVSYLKSGNGYYFKAGCYTLSNTSKGDSPEAYGELVIYELQVSHS